LVGNIDTSGGVLIPRSVPLQALPPLGKDATAQKGLQTQRIDGDKKSNVMLQQPHLFATNVISGKPYRPEVLFLYYTNPLFSNPNSDLFSKAFAEIPDRVFPIWMTRPCLLTALRIGHSRTGAG
jgi:anaerobic selenocysteine-containing dehydrogenase